VFKGPYHKPVMDYKESAHQALEYLFKEDYIKRWAKNGQPDPSYELYCYPSKVIGAVVRAMNMYSKLSPADAEEALLIARRAAEYLISVSEPTGAPLEYFTPTYSRKGYGSSPLWNQAAERHKDKLMVTYAAEAATAFLDLYDTTKEERFLSAAKRIADTYVELQMPCGTWPAMVDLKTGEPVAKNLSIPTMWIIPFLERLEEQYGMAEYKTAKEKAFNWVMENPMKTFNWIGQFEDQLLSGDYENLTAIDACYHAVYLLKHKDDNPDYVKQAQELLRFAEDQFVVWESIMPKEYQWRETLGYDNYLLPCALEQYYYMDAIGAVAAIIIKAYGEAYEATGVELYLAKACELANSMTVAQERNGKFAPGRYPTIWRKEYTEKGLIWVNCLTMDAEAIIGLAKMMEGRGGFSFAIGD
jgi:rhamnogalacturonyl hydrolase YesR